MLNETTERLEHLTFKIGRFGGDECVILVIGASQREVSNLADDIRKGIPEAVKTTFNDPSLEKTVSIGITKVQPNDNNSTLLDRADRCLREAKEQRNHIVMR